jgi:hypothetical protein
MTIVADAVGIRKLQDKGPLETRGKLLVLPPDPVHLSTRPDTLIYDAQSSAVSIAA